MKIRITAKDPDGVYESIEEAVREHVLSVDNIAEGDDLFETALEKRRESVNEKIKRWVEYGEYITVEIDTKAKTARVVPVSEAT